ncbi:hypothetical protein BCV70DRAFT_162965 [Testicularia cyperi]|uniref:Dol-P-Glc:Glc(2)Man(9)GlcNAc(2)-PP-Dol alpha-1,2-glucosyltransferase n=1 Tax=Testicularia cyperi TaxID=1882483 RepID=A0A317XM12_9BASI|nr:hypothetical protein BCV70DRAFT_162965 [Testicularia cyperi]
MQERAQDQQHQDSHQTPVSEAAQETPALPPQSARPTGPLEQSRRQSEDAATALQDILSSPSVSAKLRARSKEAYRTTLAHTIILLPPLYFFGFLYYTDVGSVTFVLAALLAVKKQRRGWAALLAAVSLLFRQTNVIWIGFIVVQDVLHRLAISGLGTSGFSDPILDSIPPSASAAWSILRTSATPFLPTLAAFAAFVRWNGAIVLGDKSNHRPEIHVPQLAYFLLFTGVFAWAPLLFAFSFSDELPLVAAAMLATPARAVTTLAVSIAIWIAVDRFTLHHPFMLSDNRHFTFYIWRRVRAYPWILYALVPVYTLLLYALSTYVAINAVTIWLFLSRPFEWPASGVDRSRSESTTMRFMW